LSLANERDGKAGGLELVHQVEAGLVAVEQGQFGRGGELAERGRHPRSGVTAGLGIESVGKELVLHGPGAAHAPVGGGHFLDHGLLDAIDRAESLEVLGEELLKALQ
jgi:hypothetical protein